jgi:hypothetical protein
MVLLTGIFSWAAQLTDTKPKNKRAMIFFIFKTVFIKLNPIQSCVYHQLLTGYFLFFTNLVMEGCNATAHFR